MKLWYQSMTRAGAWPGYNERLRGVLDRAKDDGTTIEIHGITKRGGIGDQYRYLEFIEAQEVLENVERATARVSTPSSSATSATRACARRARSRTSPCSASARPRRTLPA